MKRLATRFSSLSSSSSGNDKSETSSLSSLSSSSRSNVSLSDDELIAQLESTPLPEDPVEFITAAYEPLFNTVDPERHGRHSRHRQHPTMEMIKQYHIPRFFDKDYSITVNTTTNNLEEFLSISQELKTIFAKQQTREVARVMDRSKHQSLNDASVFFHDQSISYPPGEDEPIRLDIYSIVTIKNKKILHDHAVMDKSVWTSRNGELDCTIS